MEANKLVLGRLNNIFDFHTCDYYLLLKVCWQLKQ